MKASIATIVNGVVKGLVPGKVTITAKVGDKKANCVVTVSKRYIPVTDIILNYTELTLMVGEKITLTAQVLPENADDKYVTWSSSNTAVATVAQLFARVVTAKSPGTAIITAATKDHAVTCVVTVKDPTGIEETMGEESFDIYDISGRLVRLKAKSTEGLESGTYIINGRKTVVK